MNPFMPSRAAVTSALLALAAVACGAGAGPIDEPTESTHAALDVTCGGRFPNAAPPYAQAPDGCSSWSDNPAQVRDSWGSADFGSTCNDHDRCYYTLGSNVDDCNRAFCDGVSRACTHAYCTKILGNEVCEPVTYGTCMSIADTYCAAVRATAAGVYHKAQDKQRAWEQCVSEQTNPPPPPPPTCSNGAAEGAAWSDLRPGTRCEIVRYACKGLKIVETGTSFKRGCVEQ